MPESKSICADRMWAAWITGLPGCGKSTVALKLVEKLKNDGLEVFYLSMDERRKKYIAQPKYTPEERELAYKLFVEDAAKLVESGQCVIMDGSAYLRKWRNYARQKIRNFAEVYLECPVDMAMKREAGREAGLVMAGLYEKALERQRTGRQFKGLGDVIGVDVSFEKNSAAECIVLTDSINADHVMHNVDECLKKWRNINGLC